MAIDPAVAVGAELPEVTFSWSASDVALYHLAVGAARGDGAGARKASHLRRPAKHLTHHARQGLVGHVVENGAVQILFKLLVVGAAHRAQVGLALLLDLPLARDGVANLGPLGAPVFVLGVNNKVAERLDRPLGAVDVC